MKRKSNLLATLGLLLVAASLHALTPDEWKYRQPLELDARGPIKFSLPPSTLDLAQPDLRDLRITSADGKEVPYLLIRPTAETGRAFTAKDFQVELTNKSTILTLTTGTNQPLESVELATGAPAFLKATRIELSSDGQRWETLANGVPIFRQDGVAKTIISLARRPSAFVRLTLNDERSRPIVISGATLQIALDRPAPTEPLTPRIVRNEEFAGETVVTLDIGAAHLSLSSLEFIAEDPLFTRTISIAVRELRDDRIVEHQLARGTIYRIALEGLAPAAGLTVPIETFVPGRELIIHIENGDSPPLRIHEIHARRNPVYAVIAPTISGQLEILAGNSRANAARYDLAALSSELNRLPLTSVRIGQTITNPAYRETDPLAELTLEGAPLDTAPWKHRRSVAISTPGVQQIELDLPVLAAAQDDFSDLRLIQSGKQVPYISERTGLSRDLNLAPVAAPDSQRPSVSRWKFILPHSGLPLTRINLNTSTRLFNRSIHIYETPADARGETYQRTLASTSWTRTPDDKPQSLSLTLSEHLLTDTLWIETDNGDNPPIALERVQAFYPVIRLICKTTSPQLVELIYGNKSVATPRYDVSLIAGQLLVAERHPASLGSDQTTSSGSNLLKGAHGGVLFWAVLAIVVILLLVVVAKLLPKPNK
jgi:hypothetical protein